MATGLNLLESEIKLRDKINIEVIKKWYKVFYTKDIQVYHYTSQKGLGGILSSNALWFTDSQNLNDKSEGEYIYSLLNEVLLNYSNGNEFEVFKDELKKKIIDIDDKSIFSYNSNGSVASNMFPHYLVCSFCKNNDALAMWNYYSKSESKIGYNIKFSLKDLEISLNKAKKSPQYPSFDYRVYKVLYSLKSQKHHLREILDFYFVKWKNESSKNAVLSSLAQYLHSIKFAVKHPAFAPEKEVRIIIKIIEENFDLSSDKIQVREINDGFVPYISIPFEKSNIKHIKASPLTDNYESAKYILQKYGYSGIDVDKSGIPLRF